jgi:predicted alpha/beta-hydrolase family hydrolase
MKTDSGLLRIDVGKGETVGALLTAPENARVCYVFAHGAGAGMTHRFMESVADGLAERAIATLRYQFLYVEKGSKRPDSPALAHRVVRAAISAAATRPSPSR